MIPGSDLQDAACSRSALAFYEQIASQNAPIRGRPDPYVRRLQPGRRHPAALGDDVGAEGAYRKAMGIMVDAMNREPEEDVIVPGWPRSWRSSATCYERNPSTCRPSGRSANRFASSGWCSTTTRAIPAAGSTWHMP